MDVAVPAASSIILPRATTIATGLYCEYLASLGHTMTPYDPTTAVLAKIHFK